MIPGTMISTSRLNGILFVTALSLLLITVLSHFFGPSSETLSDFKDYGSDLASKVMPAFSGAGLGSVKDHVSRSERQYQETLAGRQWLGTQWEDPDNKTFFPCDSIPHYWTMPFSIWDFFPASFNCPHSVNRLGRMGDGGKWFCGIEKLVNLPKVRRSSPELPSSPEVEKVLDLTSGDGSEPPGKQPGCIIYSFGIQNESSFEEQLLERTPNCVIWGYDFTVDTFGPQLLHSEAQGRAHFTRAGIAGNTDQSHHPPFVSIQDLMAINGHDHIDVLKMDIEGFEFEAMDSVIGHFMDQGKEVPISEFLVEIHLMPDLISVDNFITWWEMLEEAGFRPVWTEPNLLTTSVPVYDGLPRYSEYTFINVKDKRSPFLK